MDIKKPEVGWGILSPDDELTPETLNVLELLEKLPRGQVDLLLTRAVSRYLYVDLGLNDEQEPDSTQMVTCSSALGNFFNDILGRP